MITTLSGENDVSRQDALAAMIADYTRDYGDMGLERFDGEEAGYEQMLGSVQSLPFLVPRKLVVLRRPGANKDFAEKFESFLAEVAEVNDVIIVESKLDKRLGYYKQLKQHTEFRDFAVLDANALAGYLANYAKAQGGSLSRGDARLLVDRVGTNQLSLQHELDKLLVHDPKIDRQSIEMLTERTPQSTIFELLDAVFAGNPHRAMHLYEEQRALKVEPQQIIAMLIWQLYILAVVKMAGNRNTDTIARDAKLSPYVVRKTQGLVRRISVRELKHLVVDLREFDVRLKSEGLIADEVVRYYLLSIA